MNEALLSAKKSQWIEVPRPGANTSNKRRQQVVQVLGSSPSVIPMGVPNFV